MKGIEFFRNLSIGQYVHTGSYVHRLSPATKYIGLFAFFIAVFANTTIWGSLAVLAATIVVALFARVSPVFLLRGLIPAWPFLLVLALFTLILQSPRETSPVVFGLGPLHVHAGTIAGIVLLVSRFSAVMSIICLFTSLISEREIAHGAEDALAPLKRFGFPVHEFALMIVITLRFVPIVAGELEDIVKAQSSRGAAFGSSRGGPIAKARAYLPLFVPLIIRTLERAELLAEAMGARCYIGEGRTRLAIYEKTRGEASVRLGIVVFAAASLAAGICIK